MWFVDDGRAGNVMAQAMDCDTFRLSWDLLFQAGIERAASRLAIPRW